MKKLGMGKMIGSITNRGGSSSRDQSPAPAGDQPDAVAVRAVRQFCESGGPGASGDEVTFLPTIVDAAESSPAAAAECARFIRKYLHKDYFSKPSFQYNAIMLLRILSDNPGPTFTRNLDKKFTETAKELLRNGRDLNVRQMLMETLDSFEQNKPYDEGLKDVVAMWKREKERAYKAYGGQRPPIQGGNFNAPPPREQQQSQNYFSRSHSSGRLPEPVELAHRLEEARTSAKLLEQAVQCTAPSEFLSNELIQEFADRCNSASRSIQGYMHARNPAPDNDTMESLIDTNGQLMRILEQHQRALLNAKRQAGLDEPRSNSNGPHGNPSPMGDGPSPGARPDPANQYVYPPAGGSSSRDRLNETPPPVPSRDGLENGKGKGKGKATASGRSMNGFGSGSGSGSRLVDDRGEDPFADPPSEPPPSHRNTPADVSPNTPEDEPSLEAEPHHPGFNPTPSYINRQDSAMGKVAMTGAASPPSASLGGGSSTAQTQSAPAKPGDYDDLYDK